MALSTPHVAGRAILARREVRADWIHGGTVAGALVLWLVSLQDVDLSRMNDYGLISVLPITSFLALIALTTSFAVLLRDPEPKTPIVLLHVFVLIFMLFGVTSLVQDTPRFESTWKHVGVADYVIRHGSVDPTIDAYFNWPGFFITLAFLTEITGVQSPMSLAMWAPVALELLYLGPLVLIYRRATSDRRLIWLSVWTFYLANWIGQDYLSPQGFNFFLFLAVVAILLTWFVQSMPDHPVLGLLDRLRIPAGLLHRFYAWLAPADGTAHPSSRAQRMALLVLIVLTYVVITAGHQLTPFALLGATGLMVVFYRTRLFGLPIVMAIIAVVWLRFLAGTYWAGHGAAVTSQIGSLEGSVNSNMTDRMSGSRGHEIVVYLRTGMTVAFWAAAALGVLFRLVSGRRDFTFGLLAAAPFPLIVAQSYGGEMLLRVYLFALPFMAFFASAVFFRRPDAGRSWYTTFALISVCALALPLFMVTRYGNERQDYFSTAEVAASDYLYEIAPDGSLILAGTVKAPWKDQEYELHKHRTITDEVEWDPALADKPGMEQIRDLMEDPRYTDAFLFITRSQIANDELFGLLPIPLDALETALADSGDYELIYENEDARIYRLKSRGTS